MTTRLDRLFLLLDTGSSPLTRKTAAQQLGEVQKLHPHELPLLLGKVLDYLRSSSWETRIAAAQAVEAILSNVPQWEPPPVVFSNGKTLDVATAGRLKFHQFNIEKILQNRSFLTASEGKEFDQEESHSNLNPRDRIAAQRQALNQKLGLDLASKLGIDTGDIFSNEDLEAPVVKVEPVTNIKIEVLEDAATTLAQLSSREANRAKRKARLIGKQKSRDVSQERNEEPSAKKLKRQKSSVLLVDSIPDSTGSWSDSAQIWPFESFCDVLIADLFSLNWEHRHGAGTALREITKLHGQGAGKSVDMTSEEMTTSHDLWLEDMSLRLLCVLALDRFGDFVSDQVVAPVRETSAQALGSVVNLMNKASVVSVTQVLLQLLQQQEWEARHGGLLGLKYLMAIRQDLSQEILPLVYSYLFRGLQDPIDDVSAVAAAALVPMADNLVRLLPFDEVSLLQTTLWDSLLDLDELSGSTSSILSLLSSLVANPAMGQQLESLPLADLVPRLWPFLNHSSSAVRKSTVKTLLTLLTPGHQVGWLPALATDLLRFLFQCALIEHSEDILALIQQLWQFILERLPLDSLLPSACPYVASWLCLLMQPSRVQFDPATLVFPEVHDKATGTGNKRRCSTGATTGSEVHTETKLFIAGSDSMYENSAHRERGVVRARCLGAVMLGMLSRYLVQPMPGLVYTPEMESPLDCYSKLLLVHLNSRTSIQRTVVALVIAEWAAHDENTPVPLMEKVHQCLNEAVYYDEIALAYTRLLHEAKDYVATLKHYKLAIETVFPASSGNFLSLEQIQQLAGPASLQLFASSKLKTKLAETLEERRKTLASSAVQVHNDQTALNNTTQAALARAMISFRHLPDKLNPVIKPLMDAIKTEENEQLQDIAARALANLIELCLTRNPCPNSKVIKNLCSFLCADPEYTPRVLDDKAALRGIIRLQQQQKEAEKAAAASKKQSSSSEESQALLIQRRGANMALRAVVRRFGKELSIKVPVIWEQITVPLSSVNPESPKFNADVGEVQDLVQRLQVFESTCTAMDPSLHDELMGLLPALCALLQHPFSAVRHMVSRCLAALGSLDPTRVLTVAVERIIPMLGAVDCEQMRQGSMESLSCLVEQLGLDIIPFIVLLVIPVLGRMSDTEESVRVAATQCFATLIRLMPLEGGALNPPNMSQQLVERKLRERKFLEQLFNPKKMENYQVSVPISAELRSYQQEGVNWLAFLNKYKLHGILCDDMGLGKTLQTICIIASDHLDREGEFAATKSPDAAPLPSIVVCPPTLTGHWVYEIEKFVSSTYLKPLHYSGPPVERNRLRSRLPYHNIVVASYDIVRNDLEFFSSVRWNYCVLDEGHIIKNGKTKASKAIKQLIANHRLILSGTPIQNNVLELWSLFDFLMPGFLGSEKQFQARYSKPILASRDAKASSKEQEAGALALESLHRQTLPFLLRRMKEDVLNDLPPKITQDYYCELSPLQVQLYEDFAKKHAQMDAGVTSSQTHIFQALQYLRKVCNHPKLVLSPQHPEYEKVMKRLKEQHSSLTDIQVASKLPALRQLLLDCGIGVTNSSGSNITQQEFVVSQHRALIFCQLKSMLDIIEKDLLKQHMPSVSYLRLDGSVPAGSRHSVVKRFNDDPSIDVLLLTTQVGGLGLNLTGADTVIFVEHDWNPMKDLQAMDRAHRIGQKRVVNVYRLITKATLEEKIMGLQKFKLKTANAIISTENASLQSMGTDQLLDLFSLEDRKDSKGSSVETSDTGGAAGLPGGIRVALETLPELWNEEQYENEYNLDSFIASLKP